MKISAESKPLGVATSVNVFLLLTCVFTLCLLYCVYFIGKQMPSSPVLLCCASTRTMKVTPVEQNSENKMQNRSRADQYFVFGMHILATFLGFIPYKMNMETGEVSFRWFSCKTLWSLTRLIITNSPFSFLPIVLFVIFGAGEWKPEERSRHANMTSEHVATSTVFLGVLYVEFISCYSYFILFRVAKKWIPDFYQNFHRFTTGN